MTVGTALGADAALLADVMASVEPIIIDNLSGQEPDDYAE